VVGNIVDDFGYSLEEFDCISLVASVRNHCLEYAFSEFVSAVSVEAL